MWHTTGSHKDIVYQHDDTGMHKLVKGIHEGQPADYRSPSVLHDGEDIYIAFSPYYEGYFPSGMIETPMRLVQRW